MIRRARDNDIEGIIRLLYQVNQVHADGRPDLFKSGGIKYTTDSLKELLKDNNRPVYVYDDNGTILGYVFCIFETNEETTSLYSHKSLFIDDLCVEESRRGQHIGQQLYEYVKQVAKEEECYRITLHVWECNPRAYEFYSKIGMKPLNTTMEERL